MSEAPGKNAPVPTTMPVAPPARKPPTAGDESTTWSVSARQIWLPWALRIRRWPPLVYCWPLAQPAVWSPPSMISVWPVPYRSARAAVEWVLSELKNGQPVSGAPVPALRA